MSMYTSVNIFARFDATGKPAQYRGTAEASFLVHSTLTLCWHCYHSFPAGLGWPC